MFSYYDILELLKWSGHVIRMEHYHNTTKILGRSFRGKRPLGRQCSRWEDNMQKDAVSLLHIRNWKLVAQNKENWRKKTGKAMTNMGQSTIGDRDILECDIVLSSRLLPTFLKNLFTPY
jgi:hypothetical protein